MMRSVFILSSLIVMASFVCSCRDASDPFGGQVAEVPSVFYLGREINYPKIAEILDAATQEAFSGDAEGRSYYENIVILEEASHWVVSFHLRGNGHLRKGSVFAGSPKILDGNFVLYLNKADLTPVKPMPTGSIRFVPVVDPESTAYVERYGSGSDTIENENP